jgi:hypothetical protein
MSKLIKIIRYNWAGDRKQKLALIWVIICSLILMLVVGYGAYWLPAQLVWLILGCAGLVLFIISFMSCLEKLENYYKYRN